MKLADKRHCSGCTACYAICPKHAISMKADGEGFLYPHINESLCMNCRLCEKVCPSINPDKLREPTSVYAAKAKDDAIRMASSSGGLFLLLAKQTIAKGGVVFGAAFDRSDWHVCHRFVEQEDELDELCRSKYVQSEIGECFKKVEAFLRMGRKVMFVGTPCQIAGVNHYLCSCKDLDLDNLFLVDFVCHGVPSPMVWKRYLRMRVQALQRSKSSSLKAIKEISFRCKKLGWKRFAMSIVFDDKQEYLMPHGEDTFMQGFLNNLYNRPSCHACSCRGLRSGSDLTLADYWNIHTVFSGMDDDKGVSLLLVNSDKGQVYFNEIVDELDLAESNFNSAIRVNSSLLQSDIPHGNRNKFFNRMKGCDDFDACLGELIVTPTSQRLQLLIRRILRKLRLRK